MIRSMTAFAQYEVKGAWGSASWELRSVNQRYLETHIHLPEQFRALEPAILDRIRQCLKRGKVECSLLFGFNSTIKGPLVFNKILAKQLIEAAQWVKVQSEEGEIDPLGILSWRGVMTIAQQDLEVISSALLSGIDNALKDFVSSRKTEGNALKMLIETRLRGISIETVKLRQMVPMVLSRQRQRLLSKLLEVRVQLDENRLEQELVMLAQRLDITEELDRIDAHVKETYQMLDKREIVGRRLDFMMQELNRESNTLASKSINTGMTASAIEIKVLIEQMREQIQNIE